MKNIIIVSFSIVAAIIGAGFASGQEILCYFNIFGRFGVLGIIINTLFFLLFVSTILIYSAKNSFIDYNDFLRTFKRRETRIFIKSVTILFSIAVYGAMICALAQILYDTFSIPMGISSLLCAVLATIVLSSGTDRAFALNGILGIFIVFIITLCCLYMLCYREYHTFSPKPVKAMGNGLIYSGYNLVSLTPVLISLSKRLKTPSDALSSSVSAGVLISVIMGLMFCLLSIYANKIPLGELPMLTLAKRQNDFFACIYGITLSFAVITTLLSSGGGLVDTLNIKNKPVYISLLSASAYALSGFGFSNLVNTAYRLCGIIGIFVCFAMVIVCFKNKNIQIA